MGYDKVQRNVVVNMTNDMITAGQFAKLARTTKRTVTWYDEKGLLKPAIVEENGYRYYQPYQIIDFQVILLLRKLGFSIEEIKEYLNNNHSLKDLFKLKEKVVRDQIHELEKSLINITGYYKSLDNNGTLVEPEVKEMKPFAIYYIEKEGQYAKIKEYGQELKSYFAKIPQNAVYLTIFFGGYDPEKAKMKIGVIAQDTMQLKKKAEKIVKKETIPTFKSLVYTHHGSGTLVSLLWQELAKYRQQKGLAQDMSLPFLDMEFYKRTSLNKPMEEDNMIFELYLPIK